MTLQRTRDGAVLHLTLDRPDQYNAINAELRNALIDEFDAADGAGVRAILLDGTGRGFCAGIDLGSPPPPGIATMTLMQGSTQRLVRSIVACPVPIVAAVHGTCAGIGLTLALAADYCVAAGDASFFAAFVRRGILPDGAICRMLPRMIGFDRARRFLLLGQKMPATEAAAIGMIAETVAPDALAARARAVTEEFAALPTRAVGQTKLLLARSFEVDLDTLLHEERSAQALLSTTDDFREGIAAFMEKREPRYTGN